MTTADKAAAAATTLRRRLNLFPVVQRVDIGADMNASHYVRVWLSHRTREVLALIPAEVDGVRVQISTE